MRLCTVCLSRGLRVPATFIAAGESLGLAGLGPPEWFECDEHDEHDNLAGLRRVKLTPIGDWFAAAGLPVPE